MREDRIEDHTGYRLIKLGNVAAARFEQALTPVGLRARHVRVLEAVLREALSQQGLCERTGLDRTTMVGVLDELERRELVRRERRPADRRQYVIVATPSAAAAFATAAEALTAMEREFLAPLSAAEQDLLSGLVGRLFAAHDPHCEPTPG